MYLDRLPSQDEKRLGPLRQEPRELVDQDILDLVGLLDADTDTHTVHARLNEHSFILVSGDCQRVQQQLRRRLCLDLRHVVSLRRLRCEVRDCQGRGQR